MPDYEKPVQWSPASTSELSDEEKKALEISATSLPELPPSTDFLDNRINHQIYINYCEKKYHDGDKSQLMHIFQHSVHNNQSVPSWVMQEIADNFASWEHFDHKTLDQAFDVERINFRIRAYRKKEQLSHDVYDAVEDAKKDNIPVDEQLFNMIGKKFNISGSTVRDYYYEIRTILFDSDAD